MGYGDVILIDCFGKSECEEMRFTPFLSSNLNNGIKVVLFHFRMLLSSPGECNNHQKISSNLYIIAKVPFGVKIIISLMGSTGIEPSGFLQMFKSSDLYVRNVKYLQGIEEEKFEIRFY